MARDDPVLEVLVVVGEKESEGRRSPSGPAAMWVASTRTTCPRRVTTTERTRASLPADAVVGQVH